MDHIQLQMLLTGGPNQQNKKEAFDKFDKEIEKDCTEYIKSQNIEVAPNSLVSTSENIARLTNELRIEMKFEQLSKYLQSAFLTLATDLEKKIDADQYESVLDFLLQLHDSISSLDPSNDISKELKEALTVSDRVLDIINSEAISKFIENKFYDSLSLYVLLTILNPGNSEYWYRAGLMARKCENSNLELQMYREAIEISPLSIGPRIFSIFYYINMNSLEEARSEVEKVDTLIQTSIIEEYEQELLNRAKSLLYI